MTAAGSVTVALPAGVRVEDTEVTVLQAVAVAKTVHQAAWPAVALVAVSVAD